MLFVNSIKPVKIKILADSIIWQSLLLIRPNLKHFVNLMGSVISQDVRSNMKRFLSNLSKVSAQIKEIEDKAIQDLHSEINKKYAGLIQDVFAKIVALNIPNETLKANKSILETINQEDSRLNK